MIQTTKNHIVDSLCSIETTSPLNICDRLLTQDIIALDSLHQSYFQPHLSANWHLMRGFDYNANPLNLDGTIYDSHLKQ